MAVSVSKADALMEMVKAFDNHDVKKANKIGRILSKSIQSDAKTQMYSEYIELDKESKQLFPIKVRKQRKQSSKTSRTTNIRIVTNEGEYEITLSEGMRIVEVEKGRE